MSDTPTMTLREAVDVMTRVVTGETIEACRVVRWYEDLINGLPKDAEGVPVMMGDSLWLPPNVDDAIEPTECVVIGWGQWDGMNQCWSGGYTAAFVGRRTVTTDIDCCYRTRKAAAEAAAKGGRDA